MVNKMYKVSEKEGSKHNQILMSIVVCMPVLAYGTAMGWISPHKALLMGAQSPAAPPLTEETVSWMASIMFITAPAAVFLFGAAADRFGRKRALLCASLPIAAGWAVKLASAQPLALVGARALIGFGAGGAFVVCPLYVKEISEDSIRGMTGTFVIFSQTMGNLVVFVLGDVLPYRAVLWALLAVPLAHFLALLRLPDTPDYLAKQGRTEETARVLGWLRSLPPEHAAVRAELARLALQQTHREPKFSPTLLFADKTAVKAFWVALTVNLTREFCGCIAVLVYASHIFAAAGGGGGDWLTPNQQSILLAAVQIVGSFVACQLVDRVGRKPLLAATSAVAGISLCTLAAWFYATGAGAGSPQPVAVAEVTATEAAVEALAGAGAAVGAGLTATEAAAEALAEAGAAVSAGVMATEAAAETLATAPARWLPVAALCVCIFADAAGLQPLPFVIMTEMFSFQLRGTVATLIMAISLGTDFALLKAFLALSARAGWPATFGAFAAVSLANVGYLLLRVPETARRPLVDIYRDLELRGRRVTRTTLHAPGPRAARSPTSTATSSCAAAV